MKNIKNYLKYFLIFLLFGGVAYASSGLMSGSFSLSNQKLVIKPDAFYSNFINADAISSGSITSLKLASNIDASKITGEIPSSSIPSSLVGDSNSSQTLYGRTLEYTLTNDDTKIPTSKAILDKVLPLYSCATTTLYDYSLPDTDGLEQITVTKTVSITGGQYILTGVFKCVDRSFVKIGGDVISNLYCNPGYWSNGSTNSCSEVGLGYYSTGGLNRSVCSNSTNIYINLTSSTASVNPCPNTVKEEYYYMYYSGGVYSKKCSYASIGENCVICSSVSNGNCMSGTSFVKVASNLLFVNTTQMNYAYTSAVSWCTYSQGTVGAGLGKTFRIPNATELEYILQSGYLYGTPALVEGRTYWSSEDYGTTSQKTLVYGSSYNATSGYSQHTIASDTSTTTYTLCVTDI